MPAEYGGVFINAHGTVGVRPVLEAPGYPQNSTIIYFGPSNDTVKAKCSKSMDVRFHWFRDRIKQGQITVTWVTGADNLADCFTKPLPVHRHQTLMNKLVFVAIPRLDHFRTSNARWATAFRRH